MVVKGNGSVNNGEMAGKVKSYRDARCCVSILEKGREQGQALQLHYKLSD